MGQGRGVSETIQHLAHSGLRRRLLVPPVAGGQGVLEPVRDELSLVENFIVFGNKSIVVVVMN